MCLILSVQVVSSRDIFKLRYIDRLHCSVIPKYNNNGDDNYNNNKTSHLKAITNSESVCNIVPHSLEESIPWTCQAHEEDDRNVARCLFCPSASWNLESTLDYAFRPATSVVVLIFEHLQDLRSHCVCNSVVMLYEMCINQGQKFQNKFYYSRNFPALQLTVVHTWYVYVEV
jgi:hypothetical protein